MTLNELCETAHAMAKKKGFWENSRNIPELLMLVVSELGEACEALRQDSRQKKPKAESLSQKRRLDIQVDWKKDTFEDEIADAFIRLGDLCGALDIDIEWQIKKKMEYNSSRPHKHGKKF